jgi:triosephosphate isomerase
MSERTPIMAANWKMNKTTGEAEAFVDAFLPLVAGAEADVVLAPPATALHCVSKAIGGSAVTLAAQNVNPEEKGAFTGELSPGMLVDLGCRYTIVGHSERRALYGETSDLVARKAVALLSADIRPIVCVGETLDEREASRVEEIIGSQLGGSLAGVDASRAQDVVVAYEPVWAIGTGRTATPELAQEVHGFIRARLCEQFGDAGNEIRIQYGGSVKPDNVAELMAQPDIDGGLVGGASLEPASFASIVNFDRA